ncbi:GH1 family beta-glucosidase [Actinorugispora endophytica]|uniref:Beta-glucosidase n=1 Tax=Actinorugispora endophytica TaxID=1605990 RepID=A0A4V3D8M0_9ACTN|nr:GH1 family beta-glucosidase [Actinorugispora endophytica]TDQ52409.1 broad-specificity cellobiase [Actinorugispora endophytica]
MTSQPATSLSRTGQESETGVQFPPGFVWGVATASFQIEGSTTADGRGASIWDTFSATPGKVQNGDTGDPACDHYNRYRDDVALMRDLGVGAYRFSVAWPRVQPTGSGKPLQAGLDFYDKLVDALLEVGIEPWPTLYHWDLPQTLEDAGGWPNRDTAYRFAEYAGVMYELLGDRITNWNTLNEPWCAAFLGYASGVHAPGRREPASALAAAHHLMLGHGLAANVIRDLGAGAGRAPLVGIVHNQTTVRPYTDGEADVDAARRIDALRNRIFTEPLVKGRYPEDLLADVAAVSDYGFVRDGDLETISAPLDMLGVNFYNPSWVSGSREGVDPDDLGPAEYSPSVGSEHVVDVDTGLPVTAMGWPIDATGLYDTLTRLAADYPGLPLYVTENGAAFEDRVVDGAVHDEDRIAYLDAHLRAAHEAIGAGVPLKGYFAWSLMDNFEWALGYGKRFGLVHVDYDTQVRTVKDSGLWYGRVARNGGIGAAD